MRDMMSVTFRRDVKALDRLVDQVIAGKDRIVADAADALVLDIRENWSSNAPSSPYNEPAKVTGTLDASVQKIDVRGSSGRFIGSEGNAAQATVVVKAPYARALEYGYRPRNLLPRPFFWKAVRRLEERYAQMFSTIMRT